MSFILDALKKSEAERQRQASPSLIEPAIARPRGRPTPLTIGLLALLGINSLILGVVLLRRPSVSAPPRARPAAIAAALPGAAAIRNAPHSRPDTAAMPNGATPPAPVDATGFATEVPAGAPENPVVAEARARLSAAGSAPPAPADGAVPDDPANLEALPTLAEMRFAGADALPPLHLDVHVYSPDPAQRFVFINGHKYVAGSRLAEGPRVVRIRPDGVELAYHGRRFLLPRR
jgi:general secretion pathway protein B